jgi:hypothetical protein
MSLLSEGFCAVGGMEVRHIGVGHENALGAGFNGRVG